MNIQHRLLGLVLLSSATFASAETGPVQICHQSLESGEYTQAIPWAEKAIQAGSDLHMAYICLGRAQGEIGQHDAAVTALQNADKQANTATEHIVALTLLGNEYQRGNAYDLAIPVYEKSLAVARQDDNRQFQRINLNQLGDAQRGAKRPAEALDHYRQGLALAANDNERAESYANIAASQSLLGKHDEAIEYQIKAVMMEERAGDLNHYAYANIELGRICLVAEAYQDGEKWLNKFLAITISAGSAYWEAKTRQMLAMLDRAQGRNDEALAQLEQGMALAKKIGANDLLAELKKAASVPSM